MNPTPDIRMLRINRLITTVSAIGLLLLHASGDEVPTSFEIFHRLPASNEAEETFQRRQYSDAEDIFHMISPKDDRWKTWPYFLLVRQDGRTTNESLTFEIWEGDRQTNRVSKWGSRRVDRNVVGRELDLELEFFNAFVPISVEKIRDTLLFEIKNETPWPLYLRQGSNSLGTRLHPANLEVEVRLSNTNRKLILIQDNLPLGVIPPETSFKVQVEASLDSNPSAVRWKDVDDLFVLSSRSPIDEFLVPFEWEGAAKFLEDTGNVEHAQLLQMLKELADGSIEPIATKLAPVVLTKAETPLDSFRRILFYSAMAFHRGDTRNLEADCIEPLREVYQALPNDETGILVFVYWNVLQNRRLLNLTQSNDDIPFYPMSEWTSKDGRIVQAAIQSATRDRVVFSINQKKSDGLLIQLDQSSQQLLALAGLSHSESLMDYLQILEMHDASPVSRRSWLPETATVDSRRTAGGPVSWLRIDATRKVVDSSQESMSGNPIAMTGATFSMSKKSRTYRYEIKLRNDEREPLKKPIVKLHVYKSNGTFVEEIYEFEEIGVFEEKLIQTVTEETLSKITTRSNSVTSTSPGLTVTIISPDSTTKSWVEGGRLAGVWVKVFVEGKEIADYREMPGDLKPIPWQSLEPNGN